HDVVGASCSYQIRFLLLAFIRISFFHPCQSALIRGRPSKPASSSPGTPPPLRGNRVFLSPRHSPPTPQQSPHPATIYSALAAAVSPQSKLPASPPSAPPLTPASAPRAAPSPLPHSQAPAPTPLR